MTRGDLQELVNALVASGDATAAAALVGRGDERMAMARAGCRDLEGTRALRRWDRFDLASLTKPWVATLALRLAVRGVVPLDLPLARAWPDLDGPPARVTLADLLRHRSGLAAWRPLFRMLRRPEQVASSLLQPALFDAPVPTYSDLGYVLWARTVERLTGEPLAILLRRHLLRPLGLRSVGSAPPVERAVASPLSNAREVELAAPLGVPIARRGAVTPGTPQDGNARFLGGLPGHAGLFASADAVWRLGVLWLRPGGLLPAGSARDALKGRGPYRLGWWSRSAAPRAAGPLGSEAYGHHGFTGGSLWIDPGADLVAVLLAHRSAVDADLDPWRRRFHRLALG